MKNVLLILTTLLLLFSLYAWFVVRPRLGTRPSGQLLERIKESPQYSKTKGKFVNEREVLFEASHRNIKRGRIMRRLLFPENSAVPKVRLPDLKPDMASFLAPSEDIKFIWFGHSNFILNVDGKIILVDPVFSKAASPIGFINKRFQPPPIGLTDLPEIDYILISHDHYDHLDMETIKFFRNQDTKFLVPLGVSASLIGWGIDEKKIREFDWWESASANGTDFIFTPAQHFGGRTMAHKNDTLWGGWIIKNDKQNLYYSGDTGYAGHFKVVGEKYGPFDIALISNGQYNVRWPMSHLHPKETGKAYNELRAKTLMPLHWAMFNISTHNWYDPIEEIEIVAKKDNIKLLTPMIGEVVVIGEDKEFKTWWKELIDKKD